MARHLRALSAACLLVVAGACNSFLTGDKLDSDPNRATSAQAAQLFVASQVNSYYILSGHAARVLAMWSQQMAGTDRQYIGYDQYSVTEGLFGEFSSVYTGGGLIDHRSIQADALASGNRTLVGIDKVWEALVVSFAVDNYGDVPYSQAASDSVRRPKLDPQLSVYAALHRRPYAIVACKQTSRGLNAPQQPRHGGALNEQREGDHREGYADQRIVLRQRRGRRQRKSEAERAAKSSPEQDVLRHAVDGLAGARE